MAELLVELLVKNSFRLAMDPGSDADPLLVKLRLPSRTTRAVFHTRKNEDVLLPETRGRQVADKNSYYHNGLFLDKSELGGWLLESWTVHDRRHVLSSAAELDATGRLETGVVNCFRHGRMEMDQAYLDQLLDEIGADEHFVWDDIVSL